VELAALVPDVATGVRAAIVTVLPLFFSIRLARPELAWMAFGGWLATLTDPGGSRGLRARVLLAFSILGALLVWSGQAAALSPLLAVLMLGSVAGAGSLLRALGPGPGAMGTTLAIATAIATAVPSEARQRNALWFAAGGGLAVLLSSVLWPVWRHLPVRRAVARVFEELSAYTAELDGCLAAQLGEGEERWTAVARRHPRRVRDAIEQARAMSLAVHARRSGESVMGGNLRMLLGLAEAQFLLLVTLASELEVVPPARRPAGARSVLAQTGRRDDEVRGVLLARAWRAPRMAEGSTLGVAAGPGPQRILADLERAGAAAITLVASLDREAPAAPPAVEAVPPDNRGLGQELRALGDALSSRSPIFRHAIRVACAAAVASLAGAWLSPQHAPWVTITTLAVLQPYSGATLRRAVERVVGTVLGCLVVLGIAAGLRSPLALAVSMFPLSVAAVVTRPRSYRLFSFFVTPVFVLIAMHSPGDWSTAATRAGDALLGGAIAVGAALLLYPRWEERFGMPDALAAMARAVEGYRDRVLAIRAAGEAAAGRDIAEARRIAGIAISEAEASLERRLAEPMRRGPDEARAMERITFARRLAHAVTALDTLAVHAPPGAPVPQPAVDRVQRLSALFQEALARS